MNARDLSQTCGLHGNHPSNSSTYLEEYLCFAILPSSAKTYFMEKHNSTRNDKYRASRFSGRITFFEKYPHDISINWFDKELKVNLGLDVCENSFDKTLPYFVFLLINTIFGTR